MNHTKKTITIFDQALLEIDLVNTLFKAQYSTYDPNNNKPYPTILDTDGHSGIDGRYISTMNFYSDVEFLNIQFFKDEIIKHYTNATLKNFVDSYLLDIREKAIMAVNYYNKNLLAENQIVSEYLDKHKTLSGDKWGEFTERHQAIITIFDNYQIGEIYLGLNSSTKIHNSHYRYHYVFTNNYELAERGQEIINYIDRFGLTSNAPNTAPVKPLELSKNILQLSARQELLLLKYMSDARYCDTPKSSEFSGTSRYKLYYEVFNNNQKRKPLNPNDIKAILPELEIEYPLAYKAAQNDLHQLTN